ncbi:hypothetical protein LTS10_009550 [Elasticomyces elasticus]|nr:hypothetical protein LTS10_009550 [Elasticomyces elasticus]
MRNRANRRLREAREAAMASDAARSAQAYLATSLLPGLSSQKLAGKNQHDRTTLKKSSMPGSWPTGDCTSFLLLELPRELRDMIYDLVISANHNSTQTARFAVRVHQRPNSEQRTTLVAGEPALVRVSHQVGREFIEALERSAVPHHLYYTIMPEYKIERPQLVRGFFERTKQASRLVISVGLDEAAGDRPCLGPLGLNHNSFAQLRQDVEACTKVEDVVIEWLSPLHYEQVQFSSVSPCIHYRQHDLNDLTETVQRLPKLRRFLLIMHAHAVYGVKHADGAWEISDKYRINSQIRGFKELNARSQGFLSDMGIHATTFPRHQDRGGVVDVHQWRYWGFNASSDGETNKRLREGMQGALHTAIQGGAQG